jgi:predicted nucleic acid-binding protein
VLVIDTNVLTHVLIQGEMTRAARALLSRDPEWHSEAFIFVEFSNVLVTHVRTSRLGREQAARLLGEAHMIIQSVANVAHREALQIATDAGITVYDALFLAAAQDLDQKLITEDRQLRAAAPDFTVSIEQMLNLL